MLVWINRWSSWSTQWSVSLHTGVQLSLVCLNPLKINAVCILLWYSNQWLSVGEFWFQPPPYHQWVCNLYHLLCRILWCDFVFCPDSMHYTLYSRSQCLCALLFHHSIILCTFGYTWKQPHHLIIRDIESMQSQCSRDSKCESNSRIDRNLRALTVLSHVPMGVIKIANTSLTVYQLAISWWYRSRC